jgi:DNA sulfur modification protein DndB
MKTVRKMKTLTRRKLDDSAFEYVFPAVRGVLAGREYYISMCPVRLVPKLFMSDEEAISPELRAQRTLNRSRIQDIARYILRNCDSYIFPALIASIDSKVKFETLSAPEEASQIGMLRVPMNAKVVIIDGQYRRAALELALRENTDLGAETISVVFFLDIGLKRSQQMFVDLNRSAARPSKSIGVLYDHRSSSAGLARLIVSRASIFHGVVEMEKSTLSPRSKKLFTLSAIFQASIALLGKSADKDMKSQAELAVEFWEEVSHQFPEWKRVQERKMTAGEVRAQFIHSHGIVLQAIGKAGHDLMRDFPKQWKARLKLLRSIDWSRSNSKLWEGRAIVGGRLSKSEQNIVLTTNVIKTTLKLSLTPEEQRFEAALRRGRP